ncbi:MAG: T9SS type A sorting domain-containing protein [Lewinellaceae bacterium]|nr:T9SS type A sorting domain-containing protein [Lewinellaceae bacterium]
MTGQIIREGEAAGTSVSFGTMDVPSGVYFLTCQLASGSVTITKFIINH